MNIKDYVKQNKTYNLLLNSSIKKAEETILPNEQLIYAIGVNISTIPVNNTLKIDTNIKNKISGIVVLTNQRLYFCNSIIGSQTTKQILLKDITSIDDTSMLGFGKLRIRGLTETFIIEQKKKSLQELKDKINNVLNN